MADAAAQSGSGGSTWEAEKAQLQQQLNAMQAQVSGLSNERNQYRQQVSELQAQLEPATRPVVGAGHPFAGVVDNPQAVDAYFQQLLNAQGYLTTAQAQQWAQTTAKQAYDAARGDFMVMRTYDRLTLQEPYKPLGEMTSPLAQRTAKILQERGYGKPLEGATGFDGWQYRDLSALQTAADVARLQLTEEATAAAAAAAAGQGNQAAAGLSVGQPGAAPAPVSGGEMPLKPDGSVDFDKMRADTQANVEAAGIRV